MKVGPWVRVPYPLPSFNVESLSTANVSEMRDSRGETRAEFAIVMEMVYISDLKSEFCEFKSHLSHQVTNATVTQWIE